MSSASLAGARRPHPDQVRIAALSAAMALNLVILVAAMRPLPPRMADVLPKPAPIPTVRIIEKEPTPPPAPPMLEIKPLPTPAPPTAVPRATPAPAAPPVVSVVEEGNVAAPPVSTPTLAPPSSAVAAEPVEASLAYRQAPLAYPTIAMRQRMQGTVLLRVLVDESGRPVDVQVEQSSGHPLLDRSARSQVLSGWSFQPAVVDGRAVRAWARVPVTFQLRGG
ncbi:energy transducer TonB [Dyella sp.]|uniref:energy transducer TonB n=1 Tax=Dyella sp. TaxID=1869338 RepID=UPI003F81B20C